jgi:tetratricopeptide (TPR) repeat protein
MLARSALEVGSYAQAVKLYERAQARAFQRDDAEAIGNIGYELSLARLRNGEPGEAAEEARRTQRELERRGHFAFAELFLVEAAASYEAGRPDDAERAAREALARREEGDSALAGRAHFILGMTAADRADETGLSAALAALGEPVEKPLLADRRELRGRAALLLGVAESALLEFEEAARLRRSFEDYPGMARALSFAGMAAKSAGQTARAADLYFRAGRSAVIREDWENAIAWLELALQLNEMHQLELSLASEAESLLERAHDESQL